MAARPRGDMIELPRASITRGLSAVEVEVVGLRSVRRARVRRLVGRGARSREVAVARLPSRLGRARLTRPSPGLGLGFADDDPRRDDELLSEEAIARPGGPVLALDEPPPAVER